MAEQVIAVLTKLWDVNIFSTYRQSIDRQSISLRSSDVELLRCLTWEAL